MAESMRAYAMAINGAGVSVGMGPCLALVGRPACQHRGPPTPTPRTAASEPWVVEARPAIFIQPNSA